MFMEQVRREGERLLSPLVNTRLDAITVNKNPPPLTEFMA
jgi:hypothetical protein